MRSIDSLSRRGLVAGLVIGVIVAAGSWLAAREHQPAPLGSDLTNGKWLWGDGTLAALNERSEDRRAP